MVEPKYIGFDSLLVCLGYQLMTGLSSFIKQQNIESKVWLISCPLNLYVFCAKRHKKPINQICVVFFRKNGASLHWS